MTHIPDSKMAIEEVLLADGGAVAAISGINVWHGLAKAKWANETPAVIFHVEAETGHGSAQMFIVDAVFKCYGGSSKDSDAKAVANAVITQFHQVGGVATTGGTILRSDLSTSFPAGPEPVTGWPVHVVKMRLQIAA